MKDVNILIVQPIVDESTELQASVLESFLNNNSIPDNVNIYVLIGNYAKRKYFFDYYLKYDPALIVFGGHGDDNSIIGSDLKPIITKDDLSLLTNRIVYSFNCNFGRTLRLSNYPKASIGYTEDFLIDSDNPDISLSPGFYIVEFLGLGYTVLDSYNFTIYNYEFLLNKYKNDKTLYHILYNNMKALTISGDISAKLY